MKTMNYSLIRILFALVIAEPVEINGQWVTVTTSMGIAIFPEDGGDPESLMRSADAAMYAAKHAGRNRFRFHS